MSKVFSIQAGSGPTVLFLHGIGSSATAWVEAIAQLREQFFCVAPDLPGYGGSEDVDAAGGIDALARAVLAQVPDDQPVHIVGVSFGALLALYIAKTWPGRLARLVLVDATLGRAYLPPAEKAAWLDMRANLADKLHNDSEARARKIASPRASARAIADIAFHMRRAGRSGYLNVANIIANTDAVPWLPAIQCPALVICGEDDEVTGTQMSRQLQEGLPRATWQLVAHAGHAPHIEQAEAFVKRVREFLVSA